MDEKEIVCERTQNGYLISTDKSKLNYTELLEFLTNSYWASNFPKDEILKSINNSLCFGLYEKEKQVGFARVITDYSRFAYLADVFILEKWRGKGLSKWLMKTILDFPQLKTVKWMLATKDAHGLYQQFGFTALTEPEIYMVRLAVDNKNNL